MTQTNNIYLKEIYRNLPRILSLYDQDELSPFYGVGDRDYWGWKTKDFVNGTYQGVAHGLSLLIKHNLLPDYLEKSNITTLIHSVFKGTQKITRKDGSLEEAYPFEKSFCVTSLIAYDLAETIQNLKGDISKETYEYYMSVIEPLVAFTLNNNEHHAIISNHLASAATALASWENLSETKTPKINQLLDNILSHQSEEGWFKEYNGADIGYQTLATSYLAAFDRYHTSTTLRQSLDRSFNFIKHFIHPDGSIGGIYGSRNTEFYYPDGYEYYAKDMEDAKTISQFMLKSIAEQKCVTLSSIDTPNLIPMFNSYCRAAVFSNTNEEQKASAVLPCLSNDDFLKFYEDAGLIIRNHKNYYSVFSTTKGGAGIVCDKTSPSLDTEYNYGPLYVEKKKQYFSSQANEDKKAVKTNYNNDKIEISAPLYKYKKMHPTPLQYIILRCLNLTIMRSSFINETIKKLLVRFVIKGKNPSIGTNKRTIVFSDKVQIKDTKESTGSHSIELVKDKKRFYTIHMASQGYWKS